MGVEKVGGEGKSWEMTLVDLAAVALGFVAATAGAAGSVLIMASNCSSTASNDSLMSFRTEPPAPSMGREMTDSSRAKRRVAVEVAGVKGESFMIPLRKVLIRLRSGLGREENIFMQLNLIEPLMQLYLYIN